MPSARLPGDAHRGGSLRLVAQSCTSHALPVHLSCTSDGSVGSAAGECSLRGPCPPGPCWRMAVTDRVPSEVPVRACAARLQQHSAGVEPESGHGLADVVLGGDGFGAGAVVRLAEQEGRESRRQSASQVASSSCSGLQVMRVRPAICWISRTSWSSRMWASLWPISLLVRPGSFHGLYTAMVRPSGRWKVAAENAPGWSRSSSSKRARSMRWSAGITSTFKCLASYRMSSWS